MWQKCPICDGTGKNYGYSSLLSYNPNCPTCNGQRIISELTGKPPAYEVKMGVTTVNSDGSGYKKPSVSVTSIDKCVMCGKETIYLTNTPISLRVGYVEGAGQLCSSCYKNH
jgi:RecJ-like exonuclease